MDKECTKGTIFGPDAMRRGNGAGSSQTCILSATFANEDASALSP